MPLIVKGPRLEEENTKWYQLTQIDKKTIVKTAIVVVVGGGGGSGGSGSDCCCCY